MKSSVEKNGFRSVIIIGIIFTVLFSGMGIVFAQTAEFDTVMDRAIVKNGPYANKKTADVLHDALEIFNETTPLVVDVRSYTEYSTGHIPGAINIYYRDFGKDSALTYLDSALAAHKGAGGKGEIVVYGNTRHLSMLVLAYLREMGYKTLNTNATFMLEFGFAEWTANETVAPGRFKECDTFNSTTGKGTGPAGCTTNNFTATTANPINNSNGSFGGQGYAELTVINASSDNLTEIIRQAWDARFGDPSKPDYRITAREVYDLLNDGDSSNDPYILSNRGTYWNKPTCTTPGAYYDRGHIPGATAVEWCNGNDRQELRALSKSDFLPTDRLIVHHCWVGMSQQYGGFWYNMLNYTVVSLDYGMNDWSDSNTVRQAVIKPATNKFVRYAGQGGNPDYSFDTTPELSNPGVNQYYAVSDTVNVSWSGNPTAPTPPKYVMVEFYNEDDGVTEELKSLSNSTTSYSGHIVGAGESGDDIRVYIYYADDATDKHGDPGTSDVISTSYFVDSSAPTVTINTPTSGTYDTTNITTLDVTIGDDYAISWAAYSLDGGNSKTYTDVAGNKTYDNDSISITWADGQHNITVYANDTTGKLTSSFVNFIIDAQPPRNTSLEYKEYKLLNTFHYINITWVDDGSSVDSAWMDYDNGTTTTLYPDSITGNKYTWIINETYEGIINIIAYASDSNSHEKSISFSYEVTSKTKIVHENPDNDSYWNTPNVIINGTTTIDADINYSVDSGPWEIAALGKSIYYNTTGNLSDGRHNVAVFANGTISGSGDHTVFAEFYVDTKYPEIDYGIGTMSSGSHKQDYIFVNITVNDTYLDRVVLAINGTMTKNYTISYDGNTSYSWNESLSDGQYTFKVYAIDNATNSNVTSPRTVTLDTKPPSINITSPSNNSINTIESITLVYHVSDVTSTVDWSGASLDGGTNVSGNQTFYGLPDGQHTITVYANDIVGNMRSSTVTFTMSNAIQGTYNGSIGNNTFACDSMYGGECAIAIVNITGNVTGQVNITRFDQAPDGINPLNQTTGLPNSHNASGIYIRINSNLTGSLSYALLRIYYKASDLDKNGDGKAKTPEKDIDPSSLSIYRYNESNKTWDVLPGTVTQKPPSGGYDGYILANVTNFSYFSFGGGLIPVPPPEPRGSSPYRTYIPEFTPTVVLTSSSDWHYSMLASGFVAANDYAVLVNPSGALDLAVRNNIQWFRRLIIFGGESIISKDIEATIQNLSDILEPGFFGIDIVRVNGSSFYDASTLFVDLWKDSDGKSTAKGIILTRGDVFTDTLVASQLSGATSSPIIYTAPTKLPPWTKDKIQELGLDVTIIGGEKAISPEVEEAVKALGVNVTRIGGKDRYETATLVADEYIKVMENKGKTVDTITFISGETGDWANTFGTRSYELNSVILLIRTSSRTDEFPEVNKDFIASHPKIKHASIITTTDDIEDDFTSTESYLRSIDYGVDQNIDDAYSMNRGDIKKIKKNYTISIGPVSLSTSVTGKIRDRLKNRGKMLIPIDSGPIGGDGGGEGC